LISYIEHELSQRLPAQGSAAPARQAALEPPAAAFPNLPEVDIQNDDRDTYRVLSIIAGDRPGLLSRIARVLTAYDINLP